MRSPLELPSSITSTTRYARVAQALLADISGGRYPVGTKLPTEAELEARFRVSRHTVRAAIHHLRDLGLVTARAGVGTTVRAHTVPEKAVLSMNSVAELLQFTKSTRLQFVREATLTADAELAALLGCCAGETWLRFDLLRSLIRMREPVGAVHVWVRPEFGAIAEDVRCAPHTVIANLERRFRRRAGRAAAGHLAGAHAGGPCAPAEGAPAHAGASCATTTTATVTSCRSASATTPRDASATTPACGCSTTDR